MKKATKQLSLAIACVATMTAVRVTPAQAQTNPARQVPAGTGGQQASPQELLRQNGGSLLRAQLSATPPELRNTLETVSFFHVSPPEPRTIAKHDLVTIIIREESASKSDAKADLSRESELEAVLEEFIKLNLGNFEIEGGAIGPVPPSIKASASRSFEGEGKLDRKDTFTARIQAEVIDVKPNGTLVVQARKRIRNDEEEQYFVLSGICRAEDVTADNSILSTQLFDLDLSKTARGPVNDSVKRGAVHKFLDWLNPF